MLAGYTTAKLLTAYYLASPPRTFAAVTQSLGAHDLAVGARVVSEKPFGTSQESFTELDAPVRQVGKRPRKPSPYAGAKRSDILVTPNL